MVIPTQAGIQRLLNAESLTHEGTTMAVNFPLVTPSKLKPVPGLQLGYAEAGIKKANRKDLLVMKLAPGATVAGVVIALDRMERGSGELSAVQEVNRLYGVPVISIASLADNGDAIAFGRGLGAPRLGRAQG